MNSSDNLHIVDYVWIGGNGELRSKIRVIHSKSPRLTISDVPTWNYDGSSTDQADASNSEIILNPVRLFPCPFRPGIGSIVLCDCYTLNNEPAKYNHRHEALKIFSKYDDQEPWYGLEQEYFIFDNNTGKPLGFNDNNVQGQYYCSVGSQNAFGRIISDNHLAACIQAGIKISGTNAEVAPGQWEFQIGPVNGIDAADQLWVARYILEKISEVHGVTIVYSPKPLTGDWNGSGCHINFSTHNMRNIVADQLSGLKLIESVMVKLRKNHDDHMNVYGEDNKERMTGRHETSSFDKFTYGIATRCASIRIPSETARDGKGYFEDRRPAANVDPYQATSIILKTIME